MKKTKINEDDDYMQIYRQLKDDQRVQGLKEEKDQ